MKRYTDVIESARLVDRVEATVTTGDLDYPGTAIEVCDDKGEELLHVVADPSGEIQLLFFAHTDNYRLPLARLEEIIAKAKEVIRVLNDQASHV
jgi:hypothetical protein